MALLPIPDGRSPQWTGSSRVEAVLGGASSGRAAPMYDIERTSYQSLKWRHRAPAIGVGA